MKRQTANQTLAVIFGLAFTASAHGEVIISDTFGATPDGPSIVGRDPETSLSGGKWVQFGQYTASFQSTATVGFGNPLNGTFGQTGQNVSAVSIASAGAYVKPTVLTISADLVTSPLGFAATTGAASAGRGVALGFYSSPSGVTDFSQNLFTGLVLDSSGNLNLVNDPNATGFFDPGSFKDTPIAYVGTWDASAMHRLSYTVDTTSGAISNISLEGSTASYSFTTSLFTDPATALAGVYVSSETGGITAGMDNFKVEGIPAPPPSIVTPVAVTAQSNYGPRPPVHAIDGSGMTPNSPVTTSSTCATGFGDDTMWLSDGIKSTWITFDLGSEKTLSGFHLWNYNEVNGSNRGVMTAGIYVGSTMPANGDSYESQGPAWGTLAESFTFTQAPGADGYLGEDYTFAAPVTGRYIQIYVTSGFAGADAYTGISEIRFYEYTPKAEMVSFGPGATIGPVSGNAAAISWTVPYGSNLATLAPTFSLFPGATCTVDGTPPVSGEPRNFTSPVHYIVYSSDYVSSPAAGTYTDYTVTVTESLWSYSPWTNDADSGITSASPDTVAVNCGGDAAIVNGVAFEASAFTGTNFSIGGAADPYSGTPNITGDSLTLASSFIFNAFPRTVTLSNLTPGATYETSLFAYGYDASPTTRRQTFAAGSDSLVIDQNFYGQGQGIRIAYTFVADSSGSKVLTINPVDGSSFHMSALANRQITAYSTWANGTFANAFTDKDPTLDPDGDGQTNQQEFAFGLDPTTGSSVNPITQELDKTTGVFKYARTKDSGLIYKIYYSTNLSAWTLDASATQSPATAVAGVETVTVTLAAAAPVDGKLFVRVEASPAQ